MTRQQPPPQRSLSHTPPGQQMGTSADEKPSVAARFKREDYRQTKHDSCFSKWQVLIGASDWEDYSQGKDGAWRYRVHSLPTSSGPGLYELGVAVSRSGLGRNVGKLDPDDIAVAYIGQADNVRSRLQHYGRSGAHLSRSRHSTSQWDETADGCADKGAGLFEEIFSKGYFIVYRWASMRDKRDAEKTEAQLLDTFDYAWNKGSNGARRPGDILQKLHKFASRTTRFPNIAKTLRSFQRGDQVGIKIEANKPLSPEDPVEDSKSFLSGIFKFSRSQPRLVSDKCVISDDFSVVCGYILNDGTYCRMPPVSRRKRCEEHRGMRVYGSRSKPDVYLDSTIQNDQEVQQTNTCGVNLGGGTFCQKPAVAGRKRCEEHKGMRINSFISKSIAEDKLDTPSSTSLFRTCDDGSRNSNASSSKICDPQSSNSYSVDKHFPTICGATLGNGSYCRRQPVQGNKRCWQHKGKRADSAFSGSMGSSIGGLSNTFACSVTLQDGSVCMRAPVPGRKRCEQHKGMRVTAYYCH